MKPAMIANAPVSRQPAPWRRALKHAFRDAGQLLDYLGIDRHGLELDPASPFPVMVPRPYAERMQRGDPADPLLRQVLPLDAERQEAWGFTADPVGDRCSSRDNGILHKYSGRVLVVTHGACAIHCRYCFRREFPYSDNAAHRDGWHGALDYIAGESGCREVILSGGDPLMLDTSRLRAFTDGLRGIGHVRRLRLHTRMPVVLPQRVDGELTDWLAGLPWPLVVVLHANHPQEFDTGVDAALGRLRDTGALLLNQAVLLAGINDNADTLAGLAERGLAAGILPYYLHLLDRVRGSAHFETDDATAAALMEKLRRTLPGYLVPRLVREQAGAPYKLPVM